MQDDKYCQKKLNDVQIQFSYCCWNKYWECTKKMKKFYIQIDLKEKNSDSSSSENIEENNFQVVISSDEKKKDYESENDNFIVNNE